MFQIEEFEKMYNDSNINNEKIRSLLEKINTFYKKINKNFDICTTKYQNAVKNILDSFPIVQKIDLMGKIVYEVNHIQIFDPDKIITELTEYISKFESIDYLSFLSEEKKNVVFVGANGSGKTTLLRKLQKDTKDAKIQYFQADRVLLVGDNFNPKRNYNQFLKDLKNNYDNATNVNYVWQGSAIQDQFDYYINLLERERTEEKEKGIQNGITQKIIDEWKNLVKDRELFFNHGLCVRNGPGEEPYPLKYLSSGEKSILFFLIGVLLLEEMDYYFIDEPENNLNPAIVSLLWDFIERNRPNSTFVYLTHDSNFVSSRINAKIYWIKGYNGKKWFWEKLNDYENLPQHLLIELVGNRAPVIFCESHDDSKYDSKLFKILFPSYKIISVSGCDKVCNLTKAYKGLNLPNLAYGIIDRDYKDDEWLSKLELDNVYHIPFHEIENFLCCEKFIKYMIDKFCKAEDKESSFEKIKEIVKNLFIDNKENFITHYTAFKLRDKFNYKGKIKSLKSLDDFKILYNSERLSDDKIDIVSKEYLNLYNDIIEKNDYDTYLKYLDNKGIIKKINESSIFGKDIVYDEELFNILNTQESDSIIHEYREKILKTKFS